MSRLIDADTVISFAEGEFCKEDLSKILWLISHVPTAYDVNKVVEKIENIMENESIRFVDQAVRRSVKIVKGGGVNE